MVLVCFGSRSELHWFVVFCLKILSKIELKKTEGIVTLELLRLLLGITKNAHHKELDVRPATVAEIAYKQQIIYIQKMNLVGEEEKNLRRQ